MPNTNKELLISALQDLVNEIGAAPVEKDTTRWARITAGTFHRAQNALMAVRKPRSPYTNRKAQPASRDAGTPGDGNDERPIEPRAEPAGER